MKPSPSLFILAGFAAGLSLAPLTLDAQSDTEDVELGNASPPDGDGTMVAQDEATALESAVKDELRSLGIYLPSLDKLSSAQLAGILLTLTREDQINRGQAVTAIIANGDYEVPDLSGREFNEIGQMRAVVEDSLTRAGWSADVSFLDDGQVIALFTEIAERGGLESERIEELTSGDS